MMVVLASSEGTIARKNSFSSAEVIGRSMYSILPVLGFVRHQPISASSAVTVTYIRDNLAKAK